MTLDMGSVRNIDIKDPKVFGSVLALLVGLVLLGVGVAGWLGASGEKADLAHTLNTARRNIQQAEQLRETTPDELAQQIAEVRQELDELLAPFPTSDEALAELSAYYVLAGRFDAEVVRLESVTPAEARDATLAIREESYLFEARGPFRDLVLFLAALTDSPFETFLFRDLAIYDAGPDRTELNITVLWSDLDLDTWEPPPLPEVVPEVAPEGRLPLSLQSVAWTRVSGGE